MLVTVATALYFIVAMCGYSVYGMVTKQTFGFITSILLHVYLIFNGLLPLIIQRVFSGFLIDSTRGFIFGAVGAVALWRHLESKKESK